MVPQGVVRRAVSSVSGTTTRTRQYHDTHTSVPRHAHVSTTIRTHQYHDTHTSMLNSQYQAGESSITCCIGPAEWYKSYHELPRSCCTEQFVADRKSSEVPHIALVLGRGTTYPSR
eukprot:2365090-Rhodomonas_salina.2